MSTDYPYLSYKPAGPHRFDTIDMKSALRMTSNPDIQSNEPTHEPIPVCSSAAPILACPRKWFTLYPYNTVGLHQCTI